MGRFAGILKIVGPRILGSLFAGIATWVAAKTQDAVKIDPEAAAATVTSILVAYAAGHKALSSQVNPGDAATGRVAEGIDKAANDESVDTVVRIPDTH